MDRLPDDKSRQQILHLKENEYVAVTTVDVMTTASANSLEPQRQMHPDASVYAVEEGEANKYIGGSADDVLPFQDDTG